MKLSKYNSNDIKADKLARFLLLALITISSNSCEDFVDTDPPKTEIASESVYSSEATAIAAIRGIYVEMISSGIASGGTTSITSLLALSSDDVIDFSGLTQRIEFNTNSLTTNNSLVGNLWNQAYTLIYYANSVLTGLEKASDIRIATKNQLEGEARFIRAFVNFYLVSLFGDVPLITSTNYELNNVVLRTPASEVYQHIIEDLKHAHDLLTDDYSFADNERVQPNKWAATSLLARVYLYIGDWNNAEIESSRVIDNTALYTLENDLNKVFLANSSEAILQLKPVIPGLNTNEAGAFVNVSAPRVQALTLDLVNSFEPTDNRRRQWVDSVISNNITYYHPFKYKVHLTNSPLTEYSMVFRLAEQYLIRSEARAHQGNLTDAQSDLNIIRSRAGLGNSSANELSSLLLAIEQERRVELFTEWGHRWFDLKRTQRTESILRLITIKDWQPTDTLFPIPELEIERNFRVTQNAGY